MVRVAPWLAAVPGVLVARRPAVAAGAAAPLGAAAAADPEAAEVAARDGDTRRGSPRRRRKCGGHGASPPRPSPHGAWPTPAVRSGCRDSRRGRCQIAPFGKPARHRTNREVGGVASGHLVPAQGRRIRAPPAAGAPSRRRPPCDPWRSGCSPGTPFALLFPPLAGRPAGRAPLHLAGHRQRRPAHFAESPPHGAAGRRRAGRASRWSWASRSAHARRAPPRTIWATSHTVCPRHAGSGVQVDAQFVGVIEIILAHRMGVQIDVAQVGDPHQLRALADYQFVRGAARTGMSVPRCAPNRVASQEHASGRTPRLLYR